MRQHHSVLHSLVQRVPWVEPERLMEERGADARARRLSAESQLVAMLHGQLAGAASLREIEAALASHRGRLHHPGARPVARSTPADANAKRPAAVFTDLLAALMAQARAGPRRKVEDVVRPVDSTGPRLAGLGAEWARFSAGVCGAKAHIVLDPDAAQPVCLAVTSAKVDDVTAAEAMPVEAGATHVFDLGYYDHGWWASLGAAGRRLVTRLKSNTPSRVTAELPVVDGGRGPILSDRIGPSPARLAASLRNPFHDPVREPRVRTDGGRVPRVASNPPVPLRGPEGRLKLDAPAEGIAALHRRRWAVELFFRRVKQALKVKHFLGRSENAVRIPMHRRALDRLLKVAEPSPNHGAQLAMNFA